MHEFSEAEKLYGDSWGEGGGWESCSLGVSTPMGGAWVAYISSRVPAGYTTGLSIRVRELFAFLASMPKAIE